MNGYFIFLTFNGKLCFFVCASAACFGLVLKSLASSSARALILKLLLLGRLKFASEPCLGLVLVPWSASGVDCTCGWHVVPQERVVGREVSGSGESRQEVTVQAGWTTRHTHTHTHTHTDTHTDTG